MYSKAPTHHERDPLTEQVPSAIKTSNLLLVGLDRTISVPADATGRGIMLSFICSMKISSAGVCSRPAWDKSEQHRCSSVVVCSVVEADYTTFGDGTHRTLKLLKRLLASD